MEVIDRVVYGSADSLDKDVCYFVDKLGTPQECKEFCTTKTDENANVAVVNNGVIIETYKGTPDELNNCIFYTGILHPENAKGICYGSGAPYFDIPVHHLVPRDEKLKYIRTVRVILSYLSHTRNRIDVKKALSSCSLSDRIHTLRFFLEPEDLISDDNKKVSQLDIYKVIAFQIGQSLALMDGVELYEKQKIAERYPILKPFLYRREIADLHDLIGMMFEFALQLEKRLNIIAENTEAKTVSFIDAKYNIRTEKRIEF